MPEICSRTGYLEVHVQICGRSTPFDCIPLLDCLHEKSLIAQYAHHWQFPRISGFQFSRIPVHRGIRPIPPLLHASTLSTPREENLGITREVRTSVATGAIAAATGAGFFLL